METSDSKSTFPVASAVLSANVLQVKSEQPKSQPTPKEKLRRCKKCRKTFKNHGIFLSHTKLHNSTTQYRNKQAKKALLFQQQVFHCKTCNTTCAGVEAFLEHMKGHSQQHEATYGITLPTTSDDDQEISVSDSIQIPHIQNEDEQVQQHITIAGCYLFNIDKVCILFRSISIYFHY